MSLCYNSKRMKRNDTIMKEKYMLLAIEQAKYAGYGGEVPIGAVIVFEGEVVGFGMNKRETDKNALAHAELEAIAMACKALGRWRLFGCELYVTLEPCAMCAGAIINARIDKVFYGAKDIRFGGCGSAVNLFEVELNHKLYVEGGVLEGECLELIQNFFKTLRYLKKENIIIRRADNSNREGVYKMYSAQTGMGEKEFFNDIFSGYKMVALKDGAEIGFGTINSGGEIVEIFVEESFRGNGVGRCICGYLKDKLRRVMCENVHTNKQHLEWTKNM